MKEIIMMNFAKSLICLFFVLALFGCQSGGEQPPQVVEKSSPVAAAPSAAEETDMESPAEQPQMEDKNTDSDADPVSPPTPPKDGPLDSLPLGIIGEEEPVYIENIPVSMPARVDTGAALCSIDVSHLKYFERDGKSWVSFSIKPRANGKEYQFERRVKRNVKIKRHGMEDPPPRPLVELKIKMGRLTLMRDFTLIDRQQFEYQVLIGRNLLKGLAAVDVSRVNTLAE